MAITDARALRVVTTTRALGAVACTDGKADQRRYLIEIVRPDGSVDRQVAVGGTSIDHTSEGMERGRLGAVVRVQPLPLFLGAAA
jgi:hypothetical protein